jgi:gas vesicle protein
MAKIKYNIKLWADTAENLATDTTVYKENDFIFATDTGVLKKGDGVKTYANLGSIGTVVAWANIADKPETFAPSAHDHAVVADETIGLEAAETLQGLAEALSERIADLDDRVALLEEEVFEE